MLHRLPSIHLRAIL